MNDKQNIIYNILIRMLKLFFVIIALYLVVLSFTSSSRLNSDIGWFEFYYDNIFINVLISIILIFCMYWMVNKIDNIKFLSEKRIILIQIIVMGIVCIFLNYITKYIPVADQRILTRLARVFIDTNYYDAEKVAVLKDYLEVYPFQIGIASVYQLIIRIVGMENYVEGIVGFNTICYLVSLFFLSKITIMLFNNKKVLIYQVLFTMGFTPWLIYTGFVYGDVPSLMATLGAVYFWLLYQQDTKKYGKLIICIIMFSLGYYMKTNELLFILAFGAYAVLKCIKGRNYKILLIAVLIYFASTVPIEIAKNYYNNQYDMKMEQGSPLLAHVYMGLCEDGDTGPGRYTGYVYDIFWECEGDTDIMQKETITRIKERLEYYIEHPVEGVSFLHKKNQSNYGEPLFESIESNNEYEPREGFERVVNSIHHGKIYFALRWIENIYQCVLYMFIFGYALLVHPKRNTDEFLPVIYYVGIFITFLLWEGWGKYVMPAIIFMIPLASFAMCYQLDCVFNRKN